MADEMYPYNEERKINLERKIQHCINPLHIYCRLRDMGIRKDYSKRICNLYEKNLFKYIKNRLYKNGSRNS